MHSGGDCQGSGHPVLGDHDHRRHRGYVREGGPEDSVRKDRSVRPGSVLLRRDLREDRGAGDGIPEGMPAS